MSAETLIIIETLCIFICFNGWNFLKAYGYGFITYKYVVDVDFIIKKKWISTGIVLSIKVTYYL